MPTSTIEIASAIMTRKGGHTPRLTVARPKPPFVVSGVSTKRYAPAVKQKTPVQKPPQVLLATSSMERLFIPRQARTMQVSQPGTLSTEATKVELRRPRSRPILMLTLNMTTKVQRSMESTFPGGSGATVTRGSALATTAKSPPPRPSCIPRTRVHRSAVSVLEVLKGTAGVTAKVSTTGLRSLAVAHQQPSVTTDMSETMGGVKVIDIKKPVVTGDCRAGVPTRNRRLTPPKLIFDAHSQPVQPTSGVTLLLPTSPNLSSFPSKSWTIVVDVDIKQAKTPTTIRGDETLGAGGALKPGVVGWPNDSYSPSEPASSSPTLASSPNTFQTLESPAETVIGSDGTSTISNSPTVGPSTKVSHAMCAATIISPTKNSDASQMAALAEVLRSNQVSFTTGDSEIDGRTSTTAQGAINIARSFFSAPRRASQLGAETASDGTMGSNVSRIRRLFIPPLGEDSKASKNPSTQMEIEMLRARKRVVNGGMDDPRLDRLGSLAAIAIVTKRLEASGSDGPGPSQV